MKKHSVSIKTTSLKKMTITKAAKIKRTSISEFSIDSAYKAACKIIELNESKS